MRNLRSILIHAQVLLCLGLFPISLFSQSQFQRIQDYSQNNNEGNTLRMFEGKVIVSGWYTDWPFGLNDGYHTLVFDTSGLNVDSSFFFLDSISLNPWGYHEGTDSTGNFYTGFYGIKSGRPGGRALISKHASSGDTLIVNVIDTLNSSVYGIDLYANNDIYAVGPSNVFNQGNLELTIWLLDSMLNVRNLKRISFPNTHVIPASVKVKSKNEIFIGAAHQNSPYFYKVDSTFNLVWRRFAGIAGQDGFIDVVDLDNGGIYWQGYLDTLIFGDPNSSRNPVVIKTNLEGVVKWRYFFNQSDFDEIWEAHYDSKNHRILVCGTTANDHGWLASVDTAGNFQWSREFNIPNSRRTILKDVLVSDNGFIFSCGDVSQFNSNLGTYRNNVLVLKLDSMGCLVENCVTSIPSPPEFYDGLMIYPNPNEGSFTVELPTNHNSDDFNLHVYDITGKLVYEGFIQSSKSEIHLDIDASGLFLVKCISPEAILQKRVLVVR